MTQAPLAQLAEQLTLNQWVPGSSPGGRTKIFDWWVAANRWGLDVESSDYYYPCKYRFGYQAQNYVALFSKLVELPLADLLVLQPHVYGEGVEE